MSADIFAFLKFDIVLHCINFLYYKLKYKYHSSPIFGKLMEAYEKLGQLSQLTVNFKLYCSLFSYNLCNSR
jgi:hypothetical protein